MYYNEFGNTCDHWTQITTSWVEKFNGQICFLCDKCSLNVDTDYLHSSWTPSNVCLVPWGSRELQRELQYVRCLSP